MNDSMSGNTLKLFVLMIAPPGATMVIGPVLASTGTTVSIRFDAATVNSAFSPLNSTALASMKLVPANTTGAPTTPSAGVADVRRGALRLLLSGPKSSAGHAMPDGEVPRPGGWNRIHLIVDDLRAEVARLRGAGVEFRNDIVTGPGGAQILLVDPSGNFVELFQPANRSKEG